MTTEETQKVLDELQSVRPEVLNDEAKRLFEAIMIIADERDTALRENQLAKEALKKQCEIADERNQLLRENEELKEENDILKTNYDILKGDIQKVVNTLGFPEDTIISDEFIPMINENYIPKQKIKDKIEELESELKFETIEREARLQIKLLKSLL